MKTFSVILAGVFIIWAYFSCTTPKTKNPNAPSSGSTIAVVDESASDGLDLEALIPLVKKVKDAEELEKELNKKDGINNLDLNNDGKVDFLKVTEFGSKDAYGFSLTAFPDKGEEQEVATIEIKKEQDEAAVQVSGNQQLYGQHHYYHSRFGVTEFLLMAYLLRPNPVFYSRGWGYGHYPSYYRGYSSTPYRFYKNRTRSYKSSFWSKYKGGNNYGVRKAYTPINTGLTSPNHNKTAKSGIRKSLSSPTSAQKSFRTREASKAVKSGGFGRNSTSGRSSTSRSSARSSSSRSFGGRGK
jgi:hypothetical protein